MKCENILSVRAARAKKNPDELAFIGKRVGSNFLLTNRQLSAEFRQGFAAVSRARTGRALENFASSDSDLVGCFRIVIMMPYHLTVP